MPSLANSLESLISALQCLPGVGMKTAQRMAFYLLQHERKGAGALVQHLSAALDKLRHCSRCHNFSETELCSICTASSRNAELLCVVETPADMMVIEQTNSYYGLYFVLLGRLSPLDGMGPDDVHLARLVERAHDDAVQEVILATNYTNEGEATAYYISEILSKHNIKTTRIARGLPVGAELEYVDLGTVSQAMAERRSL